MAAMTSTDEHSIADGPRLMKTFQRFFDNHETVSETPEDLPSVDPEVGFPKFDRIMDGEEFSPMKPVEVYYKRV
jgi:hypothetical protein